MPLLSESKMTSTKRMASTGLRGVVVEIGALVSDILLLLGVGSSASASATASASVFVSITTGRSKVLARWILFECHISVFSSKSLTQSSLFQLFCFLGEKKKNFRILTFCTSRFFFSEFFIHVFWQKLYFLLRRRRLQFLRPSSTNHRIQPQHQ